MTVVRSSGTVSPHVQAGEVAETGRQAYRIILDDHDHPRTELPQMRAACSATASNTGCTSDGELAITFRMSAVAVCRSSASLRLVEQPHVFDGDHGLVGERLQQLDVMR